MKHFLLTISIMSGILSITTIDSVFAATVTFDAPTVAPLNGQPITIHVTLDTQGTALSAISGTLSFSNSLFDVGSITTQDSAASVWVIRPQVSNERSFNSRTRIVFEGIMPGGFSGVRSPYYEGERPGSIFTVTLLPKAGGGDTLLLDGIEVHAFDQAGTKIPVAGFSQDIEVPSFEKQVKLPVHIESLRISPTLALTLARNEFVDANAWYVTVHEDESILPVNHIDIAETNEYSPEHVAAYEWKTMDNTYVLRFQSRSKYIHVKVFYEDGTYTTKTIAPVEKSAAYSYLSRILLGIALALLVLYRYGKSFHLLR